MQNVSEKIIPINSWNDAFFIGSIFFGVADFFFLELWSKSMVTFK